MSLSLQMYQDKKKWGDTEAVKVRERHDESLIQGQCSPVLVSPWVPLLQLTPLYPVPWGHLAFSALFHSCPWLSEQGLWAKNKRELGNSAPPPAPTPPHLTPSPAGYDTTGSWVRSSWPPSHLHGGPTETIAPFV